VTDQAVTKPIDILLVEDDTGDALLTRAAFADHKLRNRLVVLGDGREALDYLRRAGPYADVVLPDLILLDLNLPDLNLSGLDGSDLLAQDPELHTIPVVVLTHSLAEQDLLRARRLSAAGYVCRPLDFARLVEVVQRIEGLGFTVVRVPAST
jgi:CheY-like chemotaxis protein